MKSVLRRAEGEGDRGEGQSEAEHTLLRATWRLLSLMPEDYAEHGRSIWQEGKRQVKNIQELSLPSSLPNT